MTRRVRFPDDVFEVLDDERNHPNQNLGEVLMNKFPELEEEVKDREKEESALDVEDDILETDLL